MRQVFCLKIKITQNQDVSQFSYIWEYKQKVHRIDKQKKRAKKTKKKEE